LIIVKRLITNHCDVGCIYYIVVFITLHYTQSVIITSSGGVDEDILVSRDGIDKLEGMLSFREQCLAIQSLDKLLINSTIENRMPDRKNRWNVEEFIYLTCQCSINGKPYKITQ